MMIRFLKSSLLVLFSLCILTLCLMAFGCSKKISSASPDGDTVTSTPCAMATNSPVDSSPENEATSLPSATPTPVPQETPEYLIFDPQEF